MKLQSRQAKQRRLLAARGEWHPWADASEAAKQIRGMKARGATLATIAEATGVSVATLFAVTSGRQDRIRTDTAELIRSASTAAPGRRTISANGPSLLLRSLYAMGHSSPDLAAHMSQHAGHRVHQETVRRLLAGEARKVAPEVQRAAKATYEALWDKRPVEDTRIQKRNAAAARNRAQKEGWPQPMNLDDERIDEPGYRVPYQRQRWTHAEGIGIAEMEREAG